MSKDMKGVLLIIAMIVFSPLIVVWGPILIVYFIMYKFINKGGVGNAFSWFMNGSENKDKKETVN